MFQSTPDYEEAIPIPNSNVSHHVPYSVIRVIGEWEDLILAVFIMDKNLTGKLWWTLEFLSLFSYPSPPPLHSSSHLPPSPSSTSPFPLILPLLPFPLLLPLPRTPPSSSHVQHSQNGGGSEWWNSDHLVSTLYQEAECLAVLALSE